MQHEVFAELAGERVDDLFVLTGPERGDDERLRLAPREQCATVCARQQPHLHGYRADGARVTSIDALPFGQDTPSHHVLLDFLENLVQTLEHHHLVCGFIFGQPRLHSLLHDRHLRATRSFDGFGVGLDQFSFGQFADPSGESVEPLGNRRQVQRLLGAGFGQADDRVDHRLETPVAEHHRPEHHLLGKLLGLGFHHQHAIPRAGDDQVEIARPDLVKLWVQHVLSVDVTDPAAGDRTEEGNTRKRERGRRADQSHDIRIVLQVVAQHRADDLRLVAISLREQRPDRPVDQPGGEDLLLRRTPLALEEPARDLARGEALLLVVYRKREEVETRLRGFLVDDGAENLGFA